MTAVSTPGVDAPRPWYRLSTSARIIAGLLLGIAVGVFVGERARVLQPVADMYIRLMQMTVLPYLVLTLIGGLGRLDADMARRLGRRSLGLLLCLIVAALAVVALMPLTFPTLEAASFFSDALIEPRQSFALSEIYVPANPFNAMANAVVPGVVLFSAALGVALIGVKDKAPLLEALRALENAVVRVTRFIVKLTPYGVFAIAASLAGTMQVDVLERLEVYFLAFVAGSLLLAFVVLPLIVCALTPFGYREVMRLGKDAMLTAFVASNAFIVLPMLVERIREALAEHHLNRPGAQSSIDIVVPISFVVPNAGKLLTLMFVPYAAWLAGSPLQIQGYLQLFVAGVPSYFAKAQVALPFLLDMLQIPHDLFQLYIPSSIITGKFDSMVTVMSLLALALLTSTAVAGELKIAWTRIAPRLAFSVAAVAVSVVGLRLVLGAAIDTSYDRDDQLRGMYLSRARLPSTIVGEPPPEADAAPGGALQRIRERGVLRAGFVPGRVPLSFVNARGDLVGMDIELAGALGQALGVQRVEFYPTDLRRMVQLVAAGRIDVGMGMSMVAEALPWVAFSPPYLDSTIGFVVRDEDRNTFSTLDGIRERGKVTIGLNVESADLQAMLRAVMPGVELNFVTLASPKEYLTGEAPGVDALAMLAESGAAWSILYPAFSVVVPQPNPIAMPVGVAMRRGDRDLSEFLEDWTVVMRSSGQLAQMRAYWVLGYGTRHERRRWSVMDDVLGWGNYRAGQGS